MLLPKKILYNGYCISTIHSTKGEIESLYVSEEMQKKLWQKISQITYRMDETQITVKRL